MQKTIAIDDAGRGPGLMLLNELFRHPRDVGTVCASSTLLSNRMAASIDPDSEGFIVELGGGTGTITASLLRHGVRAERLIVVEKSPRLAAYLANRFPGVCVVHGDAADVPAALAQAKSVSVVVSGLPLRSLPKDAVGKIASGWAGVLGRGGRVIQFTYAPFRSSAWLQAGLQRTASETVWANLPPARVEVFAR
jgi:phosphatidylethanolamine/phosphatidyl-N-methylethanolamine N-methyltransferase